MGDKVLITRPRLDCSFKQGKVPQIEGPPLTGERALFATFIDRLAAWHAERGDKVEQIKKPLWSFELAELQALAPDYDAVYFAHRNRSQFPIGENARYYKTSPFQEFITVDPNGWGASLSFLPVEPVPHPDAEAFFERLRDRVRRNHSMFAQPPLEKEIDGEGFLLFICQLPHDETIRLHSEVTVETALSAVLDYAETLGRDVVVKGHPVNPRSMAPLKALAESRSCARWVDDVSIHACLAKADRVYMVNSGVGFEAMLHGKPVICFGRAEYDSVVARAQPTVEGLAGSDAVTADPALYRNFLFRFFQNTVEIDDPASFARVLAR